MVPEADSFREIAAFSNDDLYVRKIYDFSKDGGAISVIDLVKANQNMVIQDAWINVKEDVESGGAPTVEIGIKGGDTDAIMAATLKGALTNNKTIEGAAASKKLFVAKDAVISAEIKIATLTAGKIELNLVMRKF